ncbi:MAG: flagellar hook-basal body protein [Telluria sp.]
MDIMAIASIGMQGDLARMESISQNTANALTPGYKRQVTLNPAFSVELATAQNARGLQIKPQSAPPVSLSLDSATGSMRPTGNAQDVAIEGAAFFEVVTPTGPAYTKLGNLRADVQGRLVTGQDVPVMGAGGEIRVTNSPFSVAPNGEITQAGRIVGKLKMVTFEQPQLLTPAGAGLYHGANAQPQDVRTGVSLRIGFLEGSNVSTPQEMVRLTETMRHFEALQKLVQGYDDTLEKTIRKLGEF